jgi:hypothetical protein
MKPSITHQVFTGRRTFHGCLPPRTQNWIVAPFVFKITPLHQSQVKHRLPLLWLHFNSCVACIRSYKAVAWQRVDQIRYNIYFIIIFLHPVVYQVLKVHLRAVNTTNYKTDITVFHSFLFNHTTSFDLQKSPSGGLRLYFRLLKWINSLFLLTPSSTKPRIRYIAKTNPTARIYIYTR